MKTAVLLVLLVFAVSLDATPISESERRPEVLVGQPGTLNEVYCEYWTNCTEDCGGGKRTCPRSNGNKFVIDCHLQDCEEVEDCGKADIVYVLDDSTSIGEKNYWVTKQFAIDVIKGLTIGPENTRIGMVTYATEAYTRWQLGEYQTEDELEEAIWDLPKMGGTTNTADALLHAQQIIEQSSRASVKHIVVIITDGESNINPTRTIPQAEEMHAQGIEIFAIGIGSINEDELRGIASELKDEHWHHVPDYTALTHITNAVINETCRAMSPNKTECDEWSDWGDCEVRDGVCGAGNRSRSRECRFYNYEGADPIRRIDVDHQPCNIPCAATTEAPRHYCLNWTDCDAACETIGKRMCYRSNGRIWKIPCCGPPCNEVPCGNGDVVFILDSSASIGGRQWYAAKQFAIDVVNGLPLASQDITIGAVTFSKAATTEWRLGDYHTSEVITDLLWALPWTAGVTNSQDGLQHAKRVFEETGRSDVPRIAIFLSDGESNVHPELTIPAAEELRAIGVEVFAVAVRESGIAELQGIASEPTETFYHQIDNFDDLMAIVTTIIQQTCALIVNRK